MLQAIISCYTISYHCKTVLLCTRESIVLISYANSNVFIPINYFIIVFTALPIVYFQWKFTTMARVFAKTPVNMNYINLVLHRPFIILQMQCSNYSDNATSVDTNSPAEVLKRKVTKGELMHDQHQIKIVEELQKVYQNIQGYEPEKDSFLTKWIGKNKKKKKAPKGLYLYGAVGGGKTMLMDLFYNCCQVSPSSKF